MTYFDMYSQLGSYRLSLSYRDLIAVPSPHLSSPRRRRSIKPLNITVPDKPDKLVDPRLRGGDKEGGTSPLPKSYRDLIAIPRNVRAATFTGSRCLSFEALA